MGRSAFAGFLLAGCAYAGMAWGQTSEGGGAQLSEIVVTAQKRAERLQDVPIAVTAITAEAAKAAGVTGTAELATVTPGLTVTRTTVSALLFLRGVGTAVSIMGDEGAVNVVVDGVPYLSLPGSAFALNSIERIEVLRGPQGTLFGRNASGGVVNIVTKDPSFTPTANISAGYGNYQTVSGSFYGSTGLSDIVAADLALQYTDQSKGFGRNLFNGRDVNKQRDFSARSTVLANFNDVTRLRLSGDYFKSHSDAAMARAIMPGSVGALGRTPLPDFWDVSLDQHPYGWVESYGVTGKLQHDLDNAQITSITAYRRGKSALLFDQDAAPVLLVTGVYRNREWQFSQELQVASAPESPIQWIAGGFFLEADARLNPTKISGPAFAAIGGSDARFGFQRTRSLAGFGQVTVPLAEATNVTAGLRYTSDRRTFDYHNITGNGVGQVQVHKQSTFDKLTWRLSLDHKLSDEHMVYASYSRGFKSGLYNLINVNNPPILPETLDAFEVGMKSETFNRRLRMNVSGFYYDYKDVQLSQIVLGTAFYLNAPKAKIYGVDVDFQAAPTRNLTLSGGFEWLHARYGNAPNIPLTVPSPATCVPVPQQLPGPRTGGNTTCVINAKGNQLVKAPDFSLSLTAVYKIPSSVGDFTISGTYAYTDSYAWEADNRLQSPANSLFNGQLAWRDKDGRYGVTLWGKNLTNEKYYINQTASLGDTYGAAPPRTYGFTLDYRY